MQEITRRLHENRQIQLAKEILENAGYKVSKKIAEAHESDPYDGTKWIVDKDSAASSQVFYIDKISDDEYLLHDGRGKDDPDSDSWSKKELDDYFKELGSSVEKMKLKESKDLPDIPCGDVVSNAEAIEMFQDELDHPEDYGYDEYPEYLEISRFLLSLFKKDKSAVLYADLYPGAETNMEEEIFDTGNDYLYKGSVQITEDEDGEDIEGPEYQGYILGNRDGMVGFILSTK